MDILDENIPLLILYHIRFFVKFLKNLSFYQKNHKQKIQYYEYKSSPVRLTFAYLYIQAFLIFHYYFILFFVKMQAPLYLQKLRKEDL